MAAEKETQLEQTQFIKLIYKNNEARAIEYNLENVKVAIEENIELR